MHSRRLTPRLCQRIESLAQEAFPRASGRMGAWVADSHGPSACKESTRVPKTVNGKNGRSLPKAPTGIQGLDEITGGGLPRGRASLFCGSAGCGKTLVSIEFLVRGAIAYSEAGLFVCVAETHTE